MLVMNDTKYAEIGRKIRAIPLEKHFPSYEWEELVEKLCKSNDPALHAIGVRELDQMKHKLF
jgi:hypothetical protein